MIIDGIKAHASVTKDRIIKAVEATGRSPARLHRDQAKLDKAIYCPKYWSGMLRPRALAW